MSDGDHKSTEADVTRRAFLRRMAALAFVIPVVSSFTIDAVAHAADEHPHDLNATQPTPNQFFGNQGQAVPNQFFPNQIFPNQYAPNQIPS
jgi:hypothetical protein